ncbi:MAG TPA: DUF1844 domain-containing protein [bacterium]|uniref:DUF1844 domain-containing protein n=1 Tax=candidate division TA06 bacterium ADurb.Bin417 TaxID=1852828 RepID=A0A1V5MD42_UNCT6|nr:MAG: hypothetical protein BWY73_01161 [candidate division TA06 bacterium ADurb.Bin417]HNS48572.1 DUF1844 domain-containing protein [bacterium]
MEFIDLVMIFQAAGWQALGKFPNPANGRSEVNLPAAESAIGLLSILRDKSRGNLTQEEERVLNESIANLQLNYAAEAEKARSRPSEAGPAEKETAPKPSDEGS